MEEGVRVVAGVYVGEEVGDVIGGGVGEGLDVKFAENGIELDDLAGDARDGEDGGEIKLRSGGADGEGLRGDGGCHGGDGGLGAETGEGEREEGAEEDRAFHDRDARR